MSKKIFMLNSVSSVEREKTFITSGPDCFKILKTSFEGREQGPYFEVSASQATSVIMKIFETQARENHTVMS